MKQRIGIIGCGTMGSAIVSGLLGSRMSRSRLISVFDSVRAKSQILSQKFGVKVTRSNSQLVQEADVIVLAVKPQDLKWLGPEVRRSFKKGAVVISILAGTPLRALRQFLGTRPVLVRAMPNLGAQVGESVTALTGSHRRSLAVAEKIFSGCGKVVYVPERQFDLVTALSGSGPAYFFLLMELLVHIGVRGGLAKTTARLLAVQTALGAAKLAQASSVEPGELRRRVTSKKGTTEAALRYLERKKFPKMFSEAIARAVRRSRQLSEYRTASGIRYSRGLLLTGSYS